MRRWLVALLLVSVAASPLLGPSRKEILKHLNGRHPERAVEAADRYLQSFPGDAQAHFLRARARRLSGDRQGALEDLARARALGGDRPEFLLEEFSLTGDRRTALLLGDSRGRFLAGEPPGDRGTFVQAVWWAEDGRRRLQAGDDRGAEEAFEEALKRVPDLGRVRAYRSLARGEGLPPDLDVSTDPGFDVESVAEWLMRSERPGVHGEAWTLYYRGRVLEHLGREKEAREAFRVAARALKQSPNPELKILLQNR